MKKVIIVLVVIITLIGSVYGYLVYEEKKQIETNMIKLEQKVCERREKILSIPYGDRLVYYFDHGYSVDVRYITGVEDIITGTVHTYGNVSSYEICRLIDEYGEENLRITAIEPNSYAEGDYIRYW